MTTFKVFFKQYTLFNLLNRTLGGETALQLSVHCRLGDVVEALCRRGADASIGCPLWDALESDQEDIASSLVAHGADPDYWSDGPDGCQQTLLHKAIDENREDIAQFLIRSGCDLNSPRRPGNNGTGGDEAKDECTPLHLCCQWGLEQVCLFVCFYKRIFFLNKCEYFWLTN